MTKRMTNGGVISQNWASARTLSRMGMNVVQIIPKDPVFRGSRTTLVFEGDWTTLSRTATQCCAVFPN